MSFVGEVPPSDGEAAGRHDWIDAAGMPNPTIRADPPDAATQSGLTGLRRICSWILAASSAFKERGPQVLKHVVSHVELSLDEAQNGSVLGLQVGKGRFQVVRIRAHQWGDNVRR